MIKQTFLFTIFCLQAVLLLLFVLPASQKAVYDANTAQHFTINPSDNPASAQLYFGKGVSSLSVGESQLLAVLVDSGGANIGGAKLDITVPAHLIRLDSLSFDRSFCSSVIKQTLSATAGIAHVECTAPNPGLKTQIGTVVIVSYTALQSGAATFHINQTTAELTTNTTPSFNALKKTEDTLITITGESGQNAEVHLPLIMTLQTNSAGCLPLHVAQFEWLAPSDITQFEYELNSSPDTIDAGVQTNRSLVTIATNAGTTQYFHVRALGGKTMSTVAITNCP